MWGKAVRALSSRGRAARWAESPCTGLLLLPSSSLLLCPGAGPHCCCCFLPLATSHCCCWLPTPAAAAAACALRLDADALLPALIRSLEVMKQPAARVSVMEFTVLFLGEGKVAGLPSTATHVK